MNTKEKPQSQVQTLTLPGIPGKVTMVNASTAETLGYKPIATGFRKEESDLLVKSIADLLERGTDAIIVRKSTRLQRYNATQRRELREIWTHPTRRVAPRTINLPHKPKQPQRPQKNKALVERLIGKHNPRRPNPNHPNLKPCNCPICAR